MRKQNFINQKMLFGSLKEAFLMLSPSVQIKNPVMFVTYVGAIFATFCVLSGLSDHVNWSFNLHIVIWLWFTVLFANFAEALAESRGKAQAGSLKRSKVEAFARKERSGIEVKVPIEEIVRGDIILCEVGDVIPADGEVIEGVATIDESAVTGESAPVIRESGGDRSAVTAGTKVLSDRIKIRVTSEPGNTFLDRMIGLIEGAKRNKTPNEIALRIFLSSLTLIYVMTTASLALFSVYSARAAGEDVPSMLTIPVLVALLVCLIPTTISALLSAVGIAGMDRLIRRNVIALSGRAIEAAGDVNILILDKTGTITIGNREAAAFYPAFGILEKNFAEIAQLASLSDETPEGRSIVVLAKKRFDLRADSLEATKSVFIPFSARTRMSGVDIINPDGKLRSIRKGAQDAIKKHIEFLGGHYPSNLDGAVIAIAAEGGTPLLVSDNDQIVGIVHLKDKIKGGLKERFTKMRNMGVKTVMVTGDNLLTAAAIAAEAGVDEYMAMATPEMKLEKIRKEQSEGRLVAMMGDGTNDAPALAQADVGVAMNTGTQASREAGNMVDLDSNPTKLIEIIEIGKQMLMTRGALTTFSVVNDVAKYFAIVPAMFGSLYMGSSHTGPLSFLNIMFLSSPKSAVLSAVIFNAIVIICLIPLALKGVRYDAKGADKLLRRNIFIYGLGGLLLPFIAIKAIDIVIFHLGLV